MMNRWLKIVLGLLVIAGAVYTTLPGSFLGQSNTAYAVGDVSIDWGVPGGAPIFTVTAAAPGQVESRNVTVKNNASVVRPVGIRGVATSVDPILAAALKISITSGAATLYGPQSLSTFFAQSGSPDGISLLTLNPGQTKILTIKIVFDPTVGNEAQNKQAVFNLIFGIAAPVPAECSAITFSGNPIFGTAGSDSIRGTSANDLIYGLEGSDSIRGGGGADCIVGGGGSDSIQGEAGNDIVIGNGGSDSLQGDDGNDYVLGNEGSDSLRGGDGNDTLVGGGGSDSARGENGTDTCDAESEKTCEL